MVTPASRPSRVLKVNSVAAMARASKPRRHQALGSALAVNAKRPRHSSTAKAKALHHHGKCGVCGNSTHAITASKNSVSRLSRGKWFRRLSTAFNIKPAPPGIGVYALRRWRV